MKRADGSGVTVIRAVGMVVGLAVVGLPACTQAPPPAHPTFSRIARGDTAAIIVRYSRYMRADFDTAEGAGDSQRLIIGDCTRADTTCRHGPLATIQPRLRRPHWDDSIPKDTGEVIARIISDGPYRVEGRDSAYKFNLRGADTVYWWVGPRNGRLVSIFVSSRPGVQPLVSDLTVGPHYRMYWKQGLARWIWVEHDDAVWGTCDGGRCCRSSGLALTGQQ